MSVMDIANARRRTIRAPINPMDKTTVVSIYPKDIVEVKHTIQPGIFRISKGTFENPSLLVVGPSSWWREVDEEQPLLEITNSAIQVADSIVNDYCNGLGEVNMGGGIKPGLFYVNGSIDVKELKTKYLHELVKAKDGQIKWYKALVARADIGWARSNGNPLAVSDDMRMAARELGLQGKEWMKDTINFEMVRCQFCGGLRNPDFPICKDCKNVCDVEKAKLLGMVS